MSDPRRFQLDELTIRPGTYFNPQTEVLVIVDDSPEVDHEIFESDDFEATDWVLISDETPVDEHRRDELIEHFRVTYQPGGVRLAAGEEDDVEEVDEIDELEPDELPSDDPSSRARVLRKATRRAHCSWACPPLAAAKLQLSLQPAQAASVASAACVSSISELTALGI